MKTYFLQITTVLLLIASHSAKAQSAIDLEFYNCSNSPTSLCVNDPGVRLPDNNQSYLGESDPNASSCSVHFTQQVEIHSTCSKSFQYKIEVSYYDTSAYDEILTWQSGITNDQNEATLTFDTENATNNTVITNGLPYTSGCKRYHRIKWTVMDSCGNTASCEKRVELYDCHAPVPVSNQGFKTLNFHSNYVLLSNLDDLAGEYLDDCTSSAQYLFSTQSNIYKNDTVFQFCEVPVGVLVIIPIWIADEGRDLNCNQIISWDERNKYQVSVPVVFIADGTQDCSNHNLFISGKIKTVLGEGIAKTKVMVKDVNQSYAPVITDENGDYAFPHINYAYPVTVTAARNNDVKNGVSTLDLVLIQKHLLGIEPFTRPEQFIAADANNSYSLSAIDLVVLRKLILGLVDTLPIGKSWRFFDTTILSGTIAESIIIPSENETANVDFIGVKLGDVNYTANPQFTSVKPRSYPPVQYWATDALEYLPGDIIEIPVKCTALNDIIGFQFTLSDPDLEFLGMKEGKADIMSDDYALMNDHLTVSWFSISPLDIKPGDLLFTFVARAKNKGNMQRTLRLNSDITDAELYTANNETFIPKILFNTNNQDPLNLLSPEPNPWSTNCTIPFHVQQGGNLIFTVYTVDGAKVFTEEKDYSAGYQEIILNANDIHSSGLLFYTLQSEKETRSGKFVRLN
jgi:large repetitive protein